MPPSDLERKERELERRILEKERAIGEDVEAIRSTARSVARTASSTVTGVGVGAAVLVGAFLTWRMFRAVRRARYPRVDFGKLANLGRITLFRPRSYGRYRRSMLFGSSGPRPHLRTFAKAEPLFRARGGSRGTL